MPRLIAEVEESILQALQQRAQRNRRTVEEEVVALLRTAAQARADGRQRLIDYLLAQEKPFALNYTYQHALFDAVYRSNIGEPIALLKIVGARAIRRRTLNFAAGNITLPLMLVVPTSELPADAALLLKHLERHPVVSAVGFLRVLSEPLDRQSLLPVSERQARALETLKRLPNPPEIVWADIVLNPYARVDWGEPLWGKVDTVYAWNAEAREFQAIYDAATRHMRRVVAHALRTTPLEPKMFSEEPRLQLRALLKNVHQHTAHIPPDELEANITAAFEEYRRECE